MDQRSFAAREGFRYGGVPTNGTPAPLPEPSPTEEGPPPAGDLATIASLLAEILAELRQQVQAGYTTYVETRVNTGLVPVQILFDPPLFAISIINDGPGNLQYRLPNVGQSNWVTIRPTENDQFTLIKGKFNSIGLRDPAATSPAVRIKGLF